MLSLVDWTVMKQMAIGPQAFQTYKLGGKMSELLYSPAAYGIDLSSKDMPKPRKPAVCLPNQYHLL